MPHLVTGVEHLEKGRIEQAISELKRAVALDPRSVEAHDNLGLAYLKKGNYRAAIEQFQAEARLEKNSALAYSRLGDAYFFQRDLRRAAQALEKAKAIEPDTPQVHFNLGVVYTQLLQIGKAVEELQQCVKLNPQNDVVHYMLGDLLVRTHRLDEAQAPLQKAIELNPKVADYHHSLGLAYMQREATPERTEQAMGCFRRALALSPGHAGAHTALGLCLQRQEKKEAAEKELKEAVRLDPDQCSAHYALSNLYIQRGMETEAKASLAHFQRCSASGVTQRKRAFFQEEVDRDRGNPNVHYQLGVFYEQNGDDLRAVAAYGRAAELSPRQARTHRRLLRLYDKLGKTREAARERNLLLRLQNR